MTTFIGIDPGINGAVAFVSDRHTFARACVFDLPRHATEHRLDGYALAALMRKHAPADDETRVYLEQIHAAANHSGGGASMQSMGAMMRSVGIIEGAIDCTRFPLHCVTPQRWKKFFGLTKDKAQSLALARKLYPEMQSSLKRKKDDGRAEAVLLAHFGCALAAGSYESQDMAGAF
jgi:crossover junction endodeoxyribonuclease RuvC